LGQINSVEIQYKFDSKAGDGSLTTFIFDLKDNGIESLYSKKDTVIEDHKYMYIVNSDKTKNLGYYINKQDNILLTYLPIFKKDFYVKEDSLSSLFNWTIIDSVRTNILNYNCKLAVCNFRGRDYRVFYTEEIPFFTGPWKFNGLPGAILEAKTTDGIYSFSATRVKLSSTKIIIGNPYSDIKSKYYSFVEHRKISIKANQAFLKKLQTNEKDDDVEYSYKETSIEILK
jgi:GLPGLI family protein